MHFLHISFHDSNLNKININLYQYLRSSFLNDGSAKAEGTHAKL